jgi:hypothetical protein
MGRATRDREGERVSRRESSWMSTEKRHTRSQSTGWPIWPRGNQGAEEAEEAEEAEKVGNEKFHNT